jgi:muramidase (phage lysozyme)
VTLQDLLDAYRNANVLAFLHVIREGESSQDDSAYRMLVFGGFFDSFADHPRIHKDLVTHEVVPDWRNHPGKTSSAAGAPQITETTWDSVAKEYGFADFSPQCQDLAAIALIARRGALSDVIAGRLYAAIRKLTQEWTSLAIPKRQEAAAQVFLEYGGSLDQPASTQAAQPKEVKPMGFIPILLQMIPSLISVFGSANDSEVAKRNQAAAVLVANTVKDAVGASGIGEAIDRMQSDPAALQAATDAVHELLPQLLEGGGGGIEGARKFATDHENSRYGRILEVVSYSALLFLLIANGLAFAIGWFKDDWGRIEAVIQADIGVALMVFGFFVGSSLSSKRKDEARGVQ